MSPSRARSKRRRRFAELLTKMVARLFNGLGLRATAEASCVVRIPNANVYRFGDPDGARPVLRAVDWTVRDGESWAVVGSGAGGKTTLLEVSPTTLPAACLRILCSPPTPL
jgi:ABC-type protease/lipase transport system fused ATPase/permease subunit